MATNNLRKETYEGFDIFIVEMMERLRKAEEEELAVAAETGVGGAVTDDDRMEAFRYFWRRVGKRLIASNPTMRKWFGIGGEAWPSREQIYAMCMGMGLDRETSEKFFVEGLLAPSFQFNDYREMIFLYGIDNGLEYDTCKDMIAFFESSLDVSLEILQTSRTSVLKEQYEQKKGLSKEAFLLWMQDNANYFKGYSKTAYDYFLSLKEEVVDFAKKDANRRLKEYLSETEFDKWEKRHSLSKRSQRERIIQYIQIDARSKERHVSEMLAENIIELAGIAYSKLETNQLVLSEIFTIKRKGMDSGENINGMKPYAMTAKYLSDLLNMASKKEEAILIDIALRKLENEKGTQSCPEDIEEFIAKLSGNIFGKMSVEDAECWLTRYRKEHKRRLVMIERSDILPMVLYVAQQRYNWGHQNSSANYVQAEARQEFVELAEIVLTACNMAPLNPKYRLDSILLDSFGKDEMISFQEILEREYE